MGETSRNLSAWTGGGNVKEKSIAQIMQIRCNTDKNDENRNGAELRYQGCQSIKMSWICIKKSRNCNSHYVSKGAHNMARKILQSMLFFWPVVFPYVVSRERESLIMRCFLFFSYASHCPWWKEMSEISARISET